MTNFEEKIRPRIVFDLTIHRENFYRVHIINLTFHFDTNFFTYYIPSAKFFVGIFFANERKHP
jgi:hypothetical protein